MQNEPDKDRRIGSDQDGEDPNRRTDLLKERVVPGTHGGGGDPQRRWLADDLRVQQ